MRVIQFVCLPDESYWHDEVKKLIIQCYNITGCIDNSYTFKARHFFLFSNYPHTHHSINNLCSYDRKAGDVYFLTWQCQF